MIHVDDKTFLCRDEAMFASIMYVLVKDHLLTTSATSEIPNPQSMTPLNAFRKFLPERCTSFQNTLTRTFFILDMLKKKRVLSLAAF